MALGTFGADHLTGLEPLQPGDRRAAGDSCCDRARAQGQPERTLELPEASGAAIESQASCNRTDCKANEQQATGGAGEGRLQGFSIHG